MLAEAPSDESCVPNARHPDKPPMCLTAIHPRPAATPSSRNEERSDSRVQRPTILGGIGGLFPHSRSSPRRDLARVIGDRWSSSRVLQYVRRVGVGCLLASEGLT